MNYLPGGQDLADLLPSVDDILQEPLLSELCSDDVFKFLLKAVYEHVASLMAANWNKTATQNHQIK